MTPRFIELQAVESFNIAPAMVRAAAVLVVRPQEVDFYRDGSSERRNGSRLFVAGLPQWLDVAESPAEVLRLIDDWGGKRSPFELEAASR